MASESTSGQLNRLHRELDQLTNRQSAPLHSLLDNVSGLAGTARAEAQTMLRPLQDRSNLATVGGLGVAAAGALGWLLSGRRRRQHRRRPRPHHHHHDDAMLRQRGLSGALQPPLPPAIAPQGERRPITATPPAQITDVTRNFMLGFVMPIWMGAGIADWLCHRRARIEDNAGSKESMIHLLMLGEASLPVIAGMVLEITSPVLLMMFAAVALHAATALWDVSYAVKRRTVTPVEQHVHSYLEMVPVMATCFVTVLHWPEFRALLGLGRRRPDWSLRRKARPLPIWAVTALLSGTVLFELLPYLEELRRTRRRAS